MLLFVHRAIGDASIVLARGDGAQLAESVQEALRRGPRPPRPSILEDVLARKEADGLRYVAVLRPDGGGVEISAGAPSSVRCSTSANRLPSPRSGLLSTLLRVVLL